MTGHTRIVRDNAPQSAAIGAAPGTAGSAATFQLASQGAGGVAPGRLRALANESPLVRQLQAFQRMADNRAIRRDPPPGSRHQAGLPADLKSGMENLSGYPMDDVKVHYRSDKPAQLQAHAYAQGSNIYLAPGQEKHLPHEAWHVVQQKQGRVQATMQMKGGLGVNDNKGLEAEADVMGREALKTGAPEGGGSKKRIHVRGVRGFPGVVQRTIVTTPHSYDDPDDGHTYDFDGSYDVNLTEILAHGLPEDDPALEWAYRVLKGAKLTTCVGDAQAVADIDEVLGHIVNPAGSAFTAAGQSHRLGGSAADYASIHGTINGLLVSRQDYGLAIQAAHLKYPNKQKLNGYTKLREYVTPFVGISGVVLDQNPQLRDEVLTLFSWLIPLHDATITGIDNKNSLMYRIKICLVEKTGNLQNLATGAPTLPMDSVIRYGPTTQIYGHHLATRSEIKTSLPGALKSGEPAGPRQIETNLTNHFQYPGNGFVAGHLVADSLGGKNVTDNLSPFTNTFNTTGGVHGIRDPEIYALGRLKAGRVIFYSTTVTYGNAGHHQWQWAVRPTRVQVRVALLGLAPGGNAQDIADYTQVAGEAIYVRTP
ncbi:eCIS core domain-containing protein [Cupriavidus campinensis]